MVNFMCQLGKAKVSRYLIKHQSRCLYVLDDINISISRFSIKLIILHNVVGLIQSGQKLRFPRKRDFYLQTPSDSRLQVELPPAPLGLPTTHQLSPAFFILTMALGQGQLSRPCLLTWNSISAGH